jgi:hypothetical protein
MSNNDDLLKNLKLIEGVDPTATPKKTLNETYDCDTLAQHIFNKNPQLDNESAIITQGNKIAMELFGKKKTQHLFGSDEDFLPDVVSNYKHLQRGGLLENAKPCEATTSLLQQYIGQIDEEWEKPWEKDKDKDDDAAADEKERKSRTVEDPEEDDDSKEEVDEGSFNKDIGMDFPTKGVETYKDEEGDDLPPPPKDNGHPALEEGDDMDAYEAIEHYFNDHQIDTARELEGFISDICGYDSFDYFFEYNQGAREAVISWIQENASDVPEWKENAMSLQKHKTSSTEEVYENQDVLTDIVDQISTVRAAAKALETKQPTDQEVSILKQQLRNLNGVYPQVKEINRQAADTMADLVSNPGSANNVVNVLHQVLTDIGGMNEEAPIRQMPDHL